MVVSQFRTRHHMLGGLNNSHLFSYSFKGCKSKIKVSAGLVSSDTSLSGLWMDTLSPYPHMGLPLCMHSVRERETSGIFSSSCKDTCSIQLGPYPYDLVLP